MRFFVLTLISIVVSLLVALLWIILIYGIVGLSVGNFDVANWSDLPKVWSFFIGVTLSPFIASALLFYFKNKYIK